MSFNKGLLERYVERYNARDLDTVMDLYAEDAIQMMPDGTFEGRSAIRQRLARDLTACPDATYTVGSFIEHRDTFADEWTFTGTHTGPFADGTKPTGKKFSFKGATLIRLRGDHIAYQGDYYDAYGFLKQLGLAN